VSKDALQLVITSHIGIDAVIKKFIPPSLSSSTERADQSSDGVARMPASLSSDIVDDEDSYIGDVQQIVVDTEIVEDTSQYDTTDHDKAVDDITIQYNNDEKNQQQRVSPVSVTKFDSFFLSLKDIENERRDQCTDSLQRLHKYRGQTYDGTRRNNDDDDDNDVLVSINNSNEALQLQNKSTSSSSSPEVVQNVYGITKDVWEWGKNIPLLGGVFGLTEFTTNKLLEITIQVNDIDDILQPNLKKVDDHIVNPLIGVLSPVLSIGEEVIVKPVLHIVLPHIIGHDNDKKKNISSINGTNTYV